MKTKQLDIPTDQLNALKLAHKHHGRKAKSLIRDAWMTGNYSPLSSEIDSGALQRLRNSSGPSYLARVSLSSI